MSSKIIPTNPMTYEENSGKTKARLLQNKAFLPYCFYSASTKKPDLRNAAQ